MVCKLSPGRSPDDAPLSPLPPPCSLARSDTSSSKEQVWSGRTLSWTLPRFPGKPSLPRKKPRLETSPRVPSSPLLALARAGPFQRSRARAPSSPICGLGGGRSMSKAKQLGELWSLRHFVTPVRPNVGSHPRPRRTWAAHVSSLPASPQRLPASLPRLVSMGLGALGAQRGVVSGSVRSHASPRPTARGLPAHGLPGTLLRMSFLPLSPAHKSSGWSSFRKSDLLPPPLGWLKCHLQNLSKAEYIFCCSPPGSLRPCKLPSSSGLRGQSGARLGGHRTGSPSGLGRRC